MGIISKSMISLMFYDNLGSVRIEVQRLIHSKYESMRLMEKFKKSKDLELFKMQEQIWKSVLGRYKHDVPAEYLFDHVSRICKCISIISEFAVEDPTTKLGAIFLEISHQQFENAVLIHRWRASGLKSFVESKIDTLKDNLREVQKPKKRQKKKKLRDRIKAYELLQNKLNKCNPVQYKDVTNIVLLTIFGSQMRCKHTLEPCIALQNGLLDSIKCSECDKVKYKDCLLFGCHSCSKYVCTKCNPEIVSPNFLDIPIVGKCNRCKKIIINVKFKCPKGYLYCSKHCQKKYWKKNHF